MRVTVSREAAYDSQGRKLCSRCKRQPRAPGQRYCKECHADYKRERRKGMVERLLTPDEWILIQTLREKKGG